MDVINLGPDETRTLIVRQPLRKLGRVVRLRLADHPTRTMTLALEPSAKVVGRLLDPNGDPVRGASITAWVQPNEDFAKRLAPVATDDNGRFEYAEIPTGCAYGLQAEAAGIPFAQVADDLNLAPGETKDLGDVMVGGKAKVAQKAAEPPQNKTVAGAVLRAKAKIRGRIIDLEGRPVVGARVQVVGMWAAADDGKLDAWLAAVRAAHDASEFLEAQREQLREMPLEKETAQRPPLVTDRDGRFEIETREERVLQLRIDGERIESLFCRTVTRPIESLRVPAYLRDVAAGVVNPEEDIVVCGATFEQAAAPGCSVEGTVRDHQTAQPLPGVTVLAQRWSGGYTPLFRTTTDADGHYRLSGISARAKPTQVVALAAPDAPYIAKTFDATLERPGDRATVDFGLERGVWIEGQVTDRVTGRGVESAVSYHAWSDNPYLKRAGIGRLPRLENVRRNTDRDGNFRLLGLPGGGLVSASASGYAVGVVSENLADPKTGIPIGTQRNIRRDITQPNIVLERCNTIVKIDVAEQASVVRCDIELEPGRQRSGAVLGPDGQPLQGVHVVAGWNEHWLGDQPLEGARFTVEQLVPGRKRTLVFEHEARKLIGTIEASGDGDDPLEVRLQPWATVRGRVVDDDGKPLPGTQLGVSGPVPRRVKSDNDGRFLIEGLAPGAKHSIDVITSYVHTRLVGDFVPRAGESRDLGDVIAELPR